MGCTVMVLVITSHFMWGVINDLLTYILYFVCCSRDYLCTGLLSTERVSKIFCEAEDRNVEETNKQTKKL